MARTRSAGGSSRTPRKRSITKAPKVAVGPMDKLGITVTKKPKLAPDDTIPTQAPSAPVEPSPAPAPAPTPQPSERPRKRTRVAKAPKAPKAPKARKARKIPSPPVDESQWRESTIRRTMMITKTSAMQQYRLKKSELAGLRRQEAETVVPDINNDAQIGPMYLYVEREVEQLAWRKRGGPEGFDAYLAKRRASWEKKHSGDLEGKTFHLPCSYTPEHSPKWPHVCSGVPSSKHLNDPWTLSADLLHIKRSWVPWLWEAFNMALEPIAPGQPVYSNSERRSNLKHGLFELSPYEARPDALLASSPSVDALRAVLDRAPSHKGAPQDIPPPGLAIYGNDMTGAVYSWGPDYLEDVFNALLHVIDAHGKEGWCSARWEVYDKLSSCIPDRGISYAIRGRLSLKWYDDARFWLCGHHNRPQGCKSLGEHKGCRAGGVYTAKLRTMEGKGFNPLVPIYVPAT
ncbi:hypothetical protein PLICRDRAFT_56190 [Plicaturopsis crispa FD-325 SS-3]|nr:hypothetical protein PLICRDRAFT_56190 [Plicaturopsis crispa FD-325 SS-3]